MIAIRKIFINELQILPKDVTAVAKEFEFVYKIKFKIYYQLCMTVIYKWEKKGDISAFYRVNLLLVW